MNGRTDSAEYFYQSDFQTVLSFAQSVGLGRYTFWSVNRDRQCNPPGNNGNLSSECSSVTQNPWDFTAYTVAFAKNTRAGRRRPTPTPTPTHARRPRPHADDGLLHRAAWSSSTAYVSGNVVSYNGDKWTANQWNYDEVPGGPSGAWNNDGACCSRQLTRGGPPRWAAPFGCGGRLRPAAGLCPAGSGAVPG